MEVWHNVAVAASKNNIQSVLNPKAVKSPIRWIGGKSTLMGQLIRLLPERFDRLFEPMAGGAALFFNVQPNRAVLGDTNEDLMNYYQTLSSDTDRLVSRMMCLKASKDRYYALRPASPVGRVDTAIRFAYLNRLSWNGVHRVNRKGEFNVPMGDRLPDKLWEEEHLRHCGCLLRRAELIHGDFEETVKDAERGDFVYFDPPYPKQDSPWGGFNRYAASPYDKSDFERLVAIIEDLDDRGVLVMVSSSLSDPNLACYPRILNRHTVRSQSLISATNGGRCRATEVILRNYYEDRYGAS